MIHQLSIKNMSGCGGGVIRMLGGDDVMMGGDATSSTYQSEI